MPPRNGVDRDCAAKQHYPLRKQADFHLVSQHESVWRTD
jgi:hypothetical protein